MKIENIKISSIAYGGSGIGRLADGRVCFVRNTLPEEEVSVRITAEKKRYVAGEVVEFLQTSPHRITPACPLSGQCPGCAYLHCDYETELFCKARQLRDFIVRGNLADESVILPAVASDDRFHYRNKLTLHADPDGAVGYYAWDNRSIIPVAECLLAKTEINHLLPQTSSGNLLCRYTVNDGAQTVAPESGTILKETIPGIGEFFVGGNGFFQVNIPVAAKLIKSVCSIVANCNVQNILELYCGVGVFSIALAASLPELHTTGVELNKAAIEFARKNSAIHGVDDRCRFFAGDAGRSLKRFSGKSSPFSLILDPPRTGVEKNTLAQIASLQPEQIIYVSCAADTLTRDLKYLLSCGYKIDSSQLFDMFPCTAHFETLSVLSFHGKRK